MGQKLVHLAFAQPVVVQVVETRVGKFSIQTSQLREVERIVGPVIHAGQKAHQATRLSRTGVRLDRGLDPLECRQGAAPDGRLIAMRAVIMRSYSSSWLTGISASTCSVLPNGGKRVMLFIRDCSWVSCGAPAISAAAFDDVEDRILADAESVTDFSVRLASAHKLQHFGCVPVGFDPLPGLAPRVPESPISYGCSLIEGELFRLKLLNQICQKLFVPHTSLSLQINILSTSSTATSSSRRS